MGENELPYKQTIHSTKSYIVLSCNESCNAPKYVAKIIIQERDI